MPRRPRTIHRGVAPAKTPTASCASSCPKARTNSTLLPTACTAGLAPLTPFHSPVEVFASTPASAAQLNIRKISSVLRFSLETVLRLGPQSGRYQLANFFNSHAVTRSPDALFQGMELA
ncbi:hypothetical protein Bxe_C1010 [Paraburkholderia xenovorans LB400]|uniref:Uncharacterized protein n=1 Tax=Paraburkholderia xenovorans (strain LB400) TaxID=266265 RepID=Q13GA6_PARXL|nr:hypothetical protein Bxe_C1010 [Paraburkholderia xenovorans LB400]